ncbi:MAG: ankyrin repeat domain-containing protein [Candidatus Comchoanobacterales bacterium]
MRQIIVLLMFLLNQVAWTDSLFQYYPKATEIPLSSQSIPEYLSSHNIIKNDVPTLTHLSASFMGWHQQQTTTRHGWSPLHIAIQANDFEYVKNLFHEQPELIEQRLSSGHTPFLLAVDLNKTDIVQWMLQATNINKEASLHHQHQAIHLAAQNNNTEIINLLYNLDPNVVHQALPGGYTPLLIAAASDSLEAFELLFKLSQSNQMLNLGHHALHIAAYYGNNDIIDFLINNNEYVDQMNGYDETALHIAAKNNQRQTVKTLIQYGANLNAKNTHKATPLHLAIQEGNLSIVSLLLKHRPELLSDSMMLGNQPIHVATYFNHPKIIDYLLQLDPLQKHVLNHEQKRPIHIATEQGHADSFKLLYHHNERYQKLPSGHNLLHLAALNGKTNIIKLLLKDQQQDLIHETLPQGQTALILAAYHGHYFTTQALLFYGSYSNAVMYNGRSAMHYAGINNHHDIVELLTKNNGQANIYDLDGHSPLSLSSEYKTKFSLGYNLLKRQIKHYFYED